MNLPEIVSRDQGRAARQEFLAKEKAFTKARDTLAAERRSLPMVEVTEDYVFEGPDGKASLLDLFDGRRQLIVYHFMLGPGWTEGCDGCSFLIDNVGDLSHLHARGTSLVAVSDGPLAVITPFKARMGWTIPWYSADGTSFAADFETKSGESYRPGLSVFLRDGDTVYHTYSTYDRGGDLLLNTYNYLDLTALGRQEDWEQPAGRGDGPFMHWLRHHDRYEAP